MRSNLLQTSSAVQHRKHNILRFPACAALSAAGMLAQPHTWPAVSKPHQQAQQSSPSGSTYPSQQPAPHNITFSSSNNANTSP